MRLAKAAERVQEYLLDQQGDGGASRGTGTGNTEGAKKVGDLLGRTPAGTASVATDSGGTSDERVPPGATADGVPTGGLTERSFGKDALDTGTAGCTPAFGLQQEQGKILDIDQAIGNPVDRRAIGLAPFMFGAGLEGIVPEALGRAFGDEGAGKESGAGGAVPRSVLLRQRFLQKAEEGFHAKLTGTARGQGPMLVSEQVDELLRQATRLDKLAQMYEGWTAWW